MIVNLLSISMPCGMPELAMALKDVSREVFSALDNAPRVKREPIHVHLLFLTALHDSKLAAKGKVSFEALKHISLTLSIEAAGVLDSKLFNDFHYLLVPTMKGTNIHILSGTLASWKELIIRFGVWVHYRAGFYLTISNKLQLCFESLGFSFAFEEYSKEMQTGINAGLFILVEK